MLDLTVSILADDLAIARARLATDAVRGPLAALIHGRPESVWRGRSLVTYATNNPTDLAATVEDILALAKALGETPGPA